MNYQLKLLALFMKAYDNGDTVAMATFDLESLTLTTGE